VVARLLIQPQPAKAEREPEADELQVAAVSQYTPVCHETGTGVPAL